MIIEWLPACHKVYLMEDLVLGVVGEHEDGVGLPLQQLHPGGEHLGHPLPDHLEASILKQSFLPNPVIEQSTINHLANDLEVAPVHQVLDLPLPCYWAGVAEWRDPDLHSEVTL